MFSLRFTTSMFGAPAFADTDYGQNTVLPNIRGCGVVSYWTFHRYRSKQRYNQTVNEWFATGQIPIGLQQSGCVQSALKGAGGSNVSWSCIDPKA